MRKFVIKETEIFSEFGFYSYFLSENGPFQTLYPNSLLIQILAPNKISENADKLQLSLYVEGNKHF